MRIKVAMIILFVAGAVLAANLLLPDGTLSSLQLAQATAACPACHSGVPGYDRAITVHNVHAALACSRCHRDNIALKQADNFQNGLIWLSVGAMLIAAIGIVANFAIANRRSKVK